MQKRRSESQIWGLQSGGRERRGHSLVGRGCLTRWNSTEASTCVFF